MTDDWIRWFFNAATAVVWGVICWFALELKELRKVQLEHGLRSEASIKELSERTALEIKQVEEHWRQEMKEMVDRGRRDVESAVGRFEGRMTRFEEKFERKQDDLQKAMEDDRRIAATDRANIAAQMLTRVEFDRQMDSRFPERSRAPAHARG